MPSYIPAPEREAHWYRLDGSPCHTVPRLGGGERPTNLRDARKLGLLPSVTSILAAKARPGLERWKIEQAILSALTLPRDSREGLDAFAARVADDMGRQAREAADLGTQIHAAIEATARGVEGANPPHIARWVAAFRALLAARGWSVAAAERSVVHAAHGYAGRVDLLLGDETGDLIVADLKTTRASAPYLDWCAQLAAYREAHNAGAPDRTARRCVSLIACTREDADAEIIVREWDEAEIFAGIEAFGACHVIWRWERGMLG